MEDVINILADRSTQCGITLLILKSVRHLPLAHGSAWNVYTFYIHVPAPLACAGAWIMYEYLKLLV